MTSGSVGAEVESPAKAAAAIMGLKAHAEVWLWTLSVHEWDASAICVTFSRDPYKLLMLGIIVALGFATE
jgi:hypothetical protein